MSLINCKECGSEVSDKADKCPKCACPINSGDKQVQTIEQTGKDLKAFLAFSVVLTIIGTIVWLGFGSSVGGYMLGIGIVLFIAVRMLIWWEHE